MDDKKVAISDEDFLKWLASRDGLKNKKGKIARNLYPSIFNKYRTDIKLYIEKKRPLRYLYEMILEQDKISEQTSFSGFKSYVNRNRAFFLQDDPPSENIASLNRPDLADDGLSNILSGGRSKGKEIPSSGGGLRSSDHGNKRSGVGMVDKISGSGFSETGFKGTGSPGLELTGAELTGPDVRGPGIFSAPSLKQNFGGGIQSVGTTAAPTGIKSSGAGQRSDSDPTGALKAGVGALSGYDNSNIGDGLPGRNLMEVSRNKSAVVTNSAVNAPLVNVPASINQAPLGQSNAKGNGGNQLGINGVEQKIYDLDYQTKKDLEKYPDNTFLQLHQPFYLKKDVEYMVAQMEAKRKAMFEEHRGDLSFKPPVPLKLALFREILEAYNYLNSVDSNIKWKADLLISSVKTNYFEILKNTDDQAAPINQEVDIEEETMMRDAYTITPSGSLRILSPLDPRYPFLIPMNCFLFDDQGYVYVEAKGQQLPFPDGYIPSLNSVTVAPYSLMAPTLAPCDLKNIDQDLFFRNIDASLRNYHQNTGKYKPILNINNLI